VLYRQEIADVKEMDLDGDNRHGEGVSHLSMHHFLEVRSPLLISLAEEKREISRSCVKKHGDMSFSAIFRKSAHLKEG